MFLFSNSPPTITFRHTILSNKNMNILFCELVNIKGNTICQGMLKEHTICKTYSKDTHDKYQNF